MDAPAERADPGPAEPGTLVIGLGRESRGDDGIGPAVIRRLRARRIPGLRLVTYDGDITGLVDLWEGEATVVVVDALRSHALPGSIVRVEVGPDRPLPVGTASSTHGLSLAHAVGLGQTLGRMPRRLIVFGIEAAQFVLGADLSPELRRAVAAAAAQIAGEADGPAAPRPAPAVDHA